MRRFHPLHLAAAVVIALSGSALAQTTTGSTSLRVVPGNTTAPSTSGCAGSGGSTCTAGQSTTSTTATSGPVSSTTPTPGVTNDANASASTQTPSQSTSSGSAMGTNQTSVDASTTRPGSFEPGGAFGPAASPTTIPATLPGTTGALVLPATGTEGMPQTANQQTVVIQQPQSQARVATPIFDEAAREGRAKERQRRAQGNEPRIIGIAPNTDRDLTHQMPDDPIIRY